MTATLDQLRRLRARPAWVPTLLLLLAATVLALRLVHVAVLIVIDALERLDALARDGVDVLLGATAEGRP